MLNNDPDHAPQLVFCALASGSKGNAIYASDGQTSLLIDAGLSGAELERRMASRDIDPESISAILVSHEHSDHVRGVGVMCRRYGIPAYFNEATFKACKKTVRKIERIIPFEAGREFSVGGLTVHPFSISHDAADPVGFTIASGGVKMGVATDMGVATAMVRSHLRGCRGLLLEANHDVDMLLNGPYPWHLKQRIKGRSGHLSNEASAKLLEDMLHAGLTHVVLGHLSETNNQPELALEAAARVLDGHGALLTAARQDVCGGMIVLSGD